VDGLTEALFQILAIDQFGLIADFTATGTLKYIDFAATQFYDVASGDYDYVFIKN
jgi:hypothetical protein